MKNIPLILALTLLCITQNYLFAQEKLNIKFGKIAASDFDLSKNNFDTSVNAVVIADLGKSAFEGNNKGWFSLSFTRHTRIKILNKNGLESANIEIPLYMSGGAEEKVNSLKAATYNLESGKVIKTDLEKKSIFRDKYDKNHILVKFTLPAVKEGSVFEYSYTITSDFLTNLQPWEFQGEYPVLWSEYEVNIPDFFNYVFLSQGYFPLKHTSQTTRENFSVIETRSISSSDRYNFSSNAVLHRWVAQDAPALKTESFTSTLRNHITKIEFQLYQYRFPESPVKDIMSTWPELAKELMKDEDFGAGLLKNNSWINDELKQVVQQVNEQEAKARRIFAYVRDNYTATGNRGIGLSTSLKTTSKNKNGYVADINILLTAMLKQQGINANPVILSTRSHGYAHELYPLINRFNYVICAAEINNKTYYLDASVPGIGFDRLPQECYNGHARMILPDAAMAISLSADSITEKKISSVFIQPDKHGEWTGHKTTTAGYYESVNVRGKIKDKGEESFFKDIQSAYTGELTLHNQQIRQLEDPDSPVMIEFDFVMSQEGDVIYFNPMTWEGYKTNYFKSDTRQYPVEVPYLIDEIYTMNMTIPDGYVVDEMPKSARVKLNDMDGYFEYLIVQADGSIRLRSRLKLNRTTFLPDEYNYLREFFSLVIKKHAESIVLKKKS